jgi:hypothetical protein
MSTSRENGARTQGRPAKKAGAVAKAEPTESGLKARRGRRAKLAMDPSVNAALVIEKFGDHFGDQDLAALTLELSDSKNDLRGCEAMLYSQALALQAIFVNAAIRVTEQEWFSNCEAYMRIALKAQSQCRATVETLATIKNPAVVFARQANIAQGPQQVNNGMMRAGGRRAGGKKGKYAKRTIGRETA